MSLTLIPGRTARPARKHRAIDRLAQREKELAEMRQRLDDADALIMRQAVRLTELETSNAQLAQELKASQDALANVSKDRDAHDRWIKHLEAELADRNRRLDVGVKAEHVIAETQELSVEEIRRHCTPVPLHRAPFATVDPGRI